MTPAPQCNRCHGKKFVDVRLKNLGTLDWEWHTTVCPQCAGKGYITQEDRERVCTE